jgi:hypothetical protein
LNALEFNHSYTVDQRSKLTRHSRHRTASHCRKFQNAMVHLCPAHLRETQNTVTGLKYDFLGTDSHCLWGVGLHDAEPSPASLVSHQTTCNRLSTHRIFGILCSILRVGENIIASYNDDDIYRMDTVEHAQPHRMEYSLSDPSRPLLPDLYTHYSSPTSAATASLNTEDIDATLNR